jgi:arylsulfatase A-like enzyme
VRENSPIRRWALFTLALILIPAGAQARRNPKKPRAFHPNILLITMDTTRADHLSCYGYSRVTSPNIDRLAAGGAMFRNTYTPVPLTGPAHISLMTSLFPQEHGATINGMHMTTHAHPITLAMILHRLGYRTAAFISAWPLKRGITGLGKGFQTYNQNLTYHYKVVNVARRGDEVGKASRRWLRAHAHHPFFLWVHYFDPHHPYELHSEYSDLPLVPRPVIAKATKYTPEEVRRITAYDSEIALDDHDLGKTLKLLDELGIGENTLIVLVADHGESLGEHGYVGHGDHIYQQIIHVPMIFSYPKAVPPGTVVMSDASLVDVMPTILDLAGFPMTRIGEGRSLRPAIDHASTAAQPRPVYFVKYDEPPLLPPRWMSFVWTWAETKRTPAAMGFVQGVLKVVSYGAGQMPKTFGLENEFSTERLTTSATPARLAGYRQQIKSWYQDTNRGLKAEGHLTEEDLEGLESLGYVNP